MLLRLVGKGRKQRRQDDEEASEEGQETTAWEGNSVKYYADDCNGILWIAAELNRTKLKKEETKRGR